MDEQEQTSGLQWQELLATFLRHWKLIVLIFVPGVLASAVYAFMQGPVYEASTKLMVTSERARITVSPDPGSGTVVERVTEQDLTSEVALLRSPALVREVLASQRERIEQPHAPTASNQLQSVLSYPADRLRQLYHQVHNVTPIDGFEDWVETISNSVSVTAIKGSNLIEVSFVGSDPKWAASLVNELATHHVERHARLNQQSEALPFLEAQRQLLSDKMRQAEGTLAQFYTREGVDAAFGQRDAVRTRLAELEGILAQSKTELAEATARADFLRGEIRTHPNAAAPAGGKSASGDPQQSIRGRITELQLQRGDLLSKYAPTSLKIQEIDRQIEQARELLAKEQKPGGPTGHPLEVDLMQIEAQVAAVKARVDSLSAQIANYRGKLNHLDQISSEQERLEQEVATAKQSLLTYTKKVEEARFAEALDQSRIVNVTVAEPAEVPASPLPSKRQKSLMMGAVMSLAVGLGLAFLIDWLNPAVKSAAEAQKVSGLPILAEIPR